MNKLLLGVALTVLTTSSAMAENIGVSMALFDDNFLTVLRNSMQDYAKADAKEVCRLLKAAGKTQASIVVMMGELSNQAARQRTQDVEDVIGTPECAFMKIVEKQTANWVRQQGADLMTNWLSAGLKFDAVV